MMDIFEIGMSRTDSVMDLWTVNGLRWRGWVGDDDGDDDDGGGGGGGGWMEE